MRQFEKDPDSVKDYLVDWSAWLPEGDTITDSTMTPDSDDIHVDSHSFDATTCLIWVSGGVDGQIHKIVNHITTAGGRQEDETLEFIMKER